MTSPTKKLKSKTFQPFVIDTARLSTSLKGLNSSLAQSVGKLWWCKVTWEKWLPHDFKVQVYHTPAP